MANKNLFPKDTTKVTTVKKADKAKKEDQAKDEKPPVEAEPAETTKQEAKETAKPKAEKAKGNGKKKAKATSDLKPKKVSMIDAAQKILADAGEAMTCADMIEAMAKKNLWSSPNGRTPANTLYAAIGRLIKTKGKQSPFRKADKGQFELNPSATA